jgi:hypothetical protein
MSLQLPPVKANGFFRNHPVGVRAHPKPGGTPDSWRLRPVDATEIRLDKPEVLVIDWILPGWVTNFG